MVLRLALSGSVLLLALSGCSGSGGDGGGATHDVGIHGFAFDPATLTVPAGDTVRFANHESATHTATADGGAFDSGELREGESYDVELPAGTYAYHCRLHPSMRGTLTVTA